MTLAELYNRIKDVENNTSFPIPTPQAIVEVGTLDGATGEFTFSPSIDRRKIRDSTEPGIGVLHPGHPSTFTTIESFAPVNAVLVSLRFRVSNSQGISGRSWASKLLSLRQAKMSLRLTFKRP